MRKEIERMQAEAVKRAKEQLLQKARQEDGLTIVSALLPMPAASIKDLAFGIREAVKENLLCVIGSIDADKPALTIMLSDDMVKDHGLNAGQMVREAAKLIKGGGGGQPHFATAGGKDKDGLSAAVDKIIAMAKAKLFSALLLILIELSPKKLIKRNAKTQHDIRKGSLRFVFSKGNHGEKGNKQKVYLNKSIYKQKEIV